MTHSENWLEEATRYDPEGIFCGFCQRLNDFYDDIGWFYVSPWGSTGECRPCCKVCWGQWPGLEHVRRFGLGER